MSKPAAPRPRRYKYYVVPLDPTPLMEWQLPMVKRWVDEECYIPEDRELNDPAYYKEWTHIKALTITYNSWLIPQRGFEHAHDYHLQSISKRGLGCILRRLLESPPKVVLGNTYYRLRPREPKINLDMFHPKRAEPARDGYVRVAHREPAVWNAPTDPDRKVEIPQWFTDFIRMEYIADGYTETSLRDFVVKARQWAEEERDATYIGRTAISTVLKLRLYHRLKQDGLYFKGYKPVR